MRKYLKGETQVALHGCSTIELSSSPVQLGFVVTPDLTWWQQLVLVVWRQVRKEHNVLHQGARGYRPS